MKFMGVPPPWRTSLQSLPGPSLAFRHPSSFRGPSLARLLSANMARWERWAPEEVAFKLQQLATTAAASGCNYFSGLGLTFLLPTPMEIDVLHLLSLP
ncbi:hypothetical protein L198_04531 [Cryptococcus wingfieldii CBS 7118]|uniref:Uncharacterized protein n=1 Tax=Cryptococcus wingfieldii CBS 7118 TaxID=1295528 RepID=A0A1E3J4Y4_9TREE|nr:hypothetical protein L198_04531 [Cryptococcus wingfieldii CBS 7118]ODN95912.1 hypothetical protein L198_04531 [Cryptococcus wingfieldii CBS 7118]